MLRIVVQNYIYIRRRNAQNKSQVSQLATKRFTIFVRQIIELKSNFPHIIDIANSEQGAK